MRELNIGPGRRARCALVACLLALAGCGGKVVRTETLARPAASPPAAQPPLTLTRVNVVDGNAWSDALAVVTRSLQQAALSNGDVELMRTADNRLRLRIDAADALDRRGERLQPDFQRFTEDMAGILAPHPSVQVQVIGYSGATQGAAARQALGWARSSLRVLATHGVGAERLTARVRGTAEPEPGKAMAPGRCIEFVLSDPLVR